MMFKTLRKRNCCQTKQQQAIFKVLIIKAYARTTQLNKLHKVYIKLMGKLSIKAFMSYFIIDTETVLFECIS